MLVHYVPINYNPRLGLSKLRPLRDTKNLIITILRCTLLFKPVAGVRAGERGALPGRTVHAVLRARLAWQLCSMERSRCLS